MKQDFWQNLITDKSYSILQALQHEYDFVLIGGWAVFLYTHGIKSKDIDVIVDPTVLGQLKTKFDVIKNERLKKYEIKLGNFDIDIYLPHWSQLGLPTDYIFQHILSLEGFKVPEKEILLTLKLLAYAERKGSLKGKKDSLDLISLLYHGTLDFKKLQKILKTYGLEKLKAPLMELLNTTIEVPELAMNRKQYADFKKKTLSQIR